MKFQRVYIEITNICGLKCSFCPTKNEKPQIMDLGFFDTILSMVKGYTKEIALHVVGDPMSLSNIDNYLQLAKNHNLNVIITTSGFYINHGDVLLQPHIKQINFSLNSYNKNSPKLTFDEYLEPILKFCDKKLASAHEGFINLRLWNQNSKEDLAYNKRVYEKLQNHFKIEIDSSLKNFRVAKKILLHFDEYFIWPDINSTHQSEGYCNGLITHFAILSNGKVTPCCLDFEARVSLGDLNTQKLDEILNSKRVWMIKEGFKKALCYEEFCKKCEYKLRFKEL